MKASCLFLVIALSVATLIAAPAQTPVVVAAAPSAATETVPQQPASSAGLMKELQAIRVANEQALQKQAATLQLLDELEKEVAQLRIMASRN